ncbi:KptA family-domain-containing protein [Multifurca ochricompacta]|uniref:2'-phosphotransferase n=1 Tax=Multifurca ochricompacta TaxID=376703 RepID=A0AAD4M9H2_9AGAM|nr:KptA family-domain-containing protein [Multifurca ochricompacta]
MNPEVKHGTSAEPSPYDVPIIVFDSARPTSTKISQSSTRGGKSLRGLPKDSPDIRLSKTLSWILRHGAKSEGLYMRSDGYVRVTDLLASPRLSSHTSLDLTALQRIVKNDTKNRFMLLKGPDETAQMAGEIWWIRANQGHSLKVHGVRKQGWNHTDCPTQALQLDLKPILSAADISMAVHGTNRKAWESISSEGLSRMTRTHIHLAQGVPGEGVISGWFDPLHTGHSS